ncbi:endolytic transglycosylase MltG [Streptomyces bambusae]|uniref:Endolytic murein transglycosylase n=1 Tax=Streptomyces bambusae TaxID=1550616 RepID=A0ABS6Z3B8_9ACTN|nr:endolytic transglycosylase MltG [Streptomyces bambusae]MBW5482071.1 endolytic transglycosylase MltG [Streptomyces bambusae]
MTEYGRGQAPEPWHPEDPLYGDPGWTGQHQVPQHYPQDQQQYQQPQAQYQQHQQYPQQQYATQQHQQYPEQYGQQVQPQMQPQQMHPQMHPQQMQPHMQQPVAQQTYGGQAWDTGQMIGLTDPQAAHPQAAHPQVAADPYATGQTYVGADPYAGGEAYAGAAGYAQQPAGYPGEAPDLYTSDEAYPPPAPPNQRHLAPERTEDAPDTDEDDDEADEPASAGRRTDRKGAKGAKGGNGAASGKSGKSGKGKKKGRNGVACLFTSLVLIGIVGGGGYYGYSFLQDRFGAPADFTGAGTEPIDVEIKPGSGLGQMGRTLKEAGVVASAEAFVSAASANPKGKNIQPGVYPLRKRMSAKEAVAVMVDPTKLNVVTIPEGWRNAAVYEAIDKKLKLQSGTTKDVAKRELKNLGLPTWADSANPKMIDPLEGFLYPARYDLTVGMKPEDLLKQMVAKANESYAAHGVEAKAKELGLSSPLQVVTIASMVQAEGMSHDDFKKMSDVIYNRLKPTNTVTNRKLEFDSTINYLKGTSNINVSRTETRTLDNPYNTYFHAGLTPGPIGNPGDDAVNAAMNPDGGGWMFFVSVDGKKTTFTRTFEEHDELVKEFNRRQSNR